MRDQILVVDDNPMIQELFKMELEDEGFDVQATGDPDEALKIVAASKQMKLVISDGMEEARLTGAELMRRIRIERPDIATMMVTSERPAGWDEPQIPIFIKPLYGKLLTQNVRQVLASSPHFV